MTPLDQALLADLAKDLIAITESYHSWPELDANVKEYCQLITDRLSEFGVNMEDGK